MVARLMLNLRVGEDKRAPRPLSYARQDTTFVRDNLSSRASPPKWTFEESVMGNLGEEVALESFWGSDGEGSGGGEDAMVERGHDVFKRYDDVIELTVRYPQCGEEE